MLVDLLGRVLGDVARTIASTWPYVLLSVVAAAALQVYVGTNRLEGWLRRRTAVAIAAAVGLATATPFCSCGTTAVTLGMLATTAPWAPIVAFVVSSPLTSPSELLFSAGLLGWPFAWIFFGGTIVLGLVAGAVTVPIERRGWLSGQARMRPLPVVAESPALVAVGAAMPALATPACADGCASTGSSPAASSPTVEPRAGGSATLSERLRLRRMAREVAIVGRKLGAFFLGFTAIGYLLIEAIPTQWLESALGGESPLAVVAAALLGIPMYVNTEGSLPLVAGLMDGGMGPGPAMAFLVTGSGTSIGALTGMLVIARRRVVALIVALLFAGAVVLGLLAQNVLA